MICHKFLSFIPLYTCSCQSYRHTRIFIYTKNLVGFCIHKLRFKDEENSHGCITYKNMKNVYFDLKTLESAGLIQSLKNTHNTTVLYFDDFESQFGFFPLKLVL